MAFMTASNILTVLRIILVPFFAACILINSVYTIFAAFVIFIVAAVTDRYDGILARQRKEITDFGKILDPIADKILVGAGVLALVYWKVIPLWMVIIILIREIGITWIRIVFMKREIILAAEKAGKWKAAFQMTAIITTLFLLVLRSYFMVFLNMHVKQFGFPYTQIMIYLPYVLMLLAVIFTVYSGILFFVNNKKLIFGKMG